MKMTKKYKIPIIIISLLLIIIVGVGVLYFTRKPEQKITIENKDNISKYNYTLRENDSSLKEEKFNQLKDILEQEEIDDTKYAQTLAEIFVIDVYNLNSKLNKYDIGGLEYIYESEKTKFKNIMQDTLYNSVEDNTLNNRDQELPEVISVSTENIVKDEFEYNENLYPSWNIQIKIDYKKDLGYDNSVLVTVIKEQNKLYVVEINPI